MSVQTKIPVPAPDAVPSYFTRDAAAQRGVAEIARGDAILLRETDPIWQAWAYWEPI